ncbi:hypothetical protein TIFTF001_035650 [Ficus carica]|uniref:Uncharacterized protein n=1 Tax=Ficus carica TaxID=3494 RepID=A0AA88J9W3_FICCA|nr:hypothetical protein TIFTF001_035650 [Ficus carica]
MCSRASTPIQLCNSSPSLPFGYPFESNETSIRSPLVLTTCTLLRRVALRLPYSSTLNLDGNYSFWTTTINKFNILDGNYPNSCITQAIYITTYRLVERGYGQNGRKYGKTWVVDGKRDREIQKQASLVDPSENGGGRMSGGGCRRRTTPREKLEKWCGEIERVFGDFKGREQRERNGGRIYIGYGV